MSRSQLTAAEYRQIVMAGRKEQLLLNKETAARLSDTLKRAADHLHALYIDLPDIGEDLRKTYLHARQKDLIALTEVLYTEYNDLVNGGMLELAQAAVNREHRLYKLDSPAFHDPRMDATQSRRLLLGDHHMRIGFSPVAAQSVERVAARVYRDGLKLSDRLWKQQKEARAGLEDRLVQAFATGESAESLAKGLRGYLIEPGADNAYYRAMRLARTEINNAHREAHIQSSLDPRTGQLRGFIEGIGFRLSMSHPHSDICDIYASDDGEGLGPGNYLPGDVPVGHAHCLCYTISVMKRFPEDAIPKKQPDPAAVPDSMVRYYAEHVGDPTAARELARRKN